MVIYNVLRIMKCFLIIECWLNCMVRNAIRDKKSSGSNLAISVTYSSVSFCATDGRFPTVYIYPPVAWEKRILQFIVPHWMLWSNEFKHIHHWIPIMGETVLCSFKKVWRNYLRLRTFSLLKTHPSTDIVRGCADLIGKRQWQASWHWLWAASPP
jgi:hypothetical protein